MNLLTPNLETLLKVKYNVLPFNNQKAIWQTLQNKNSFVKFTFSSASTGQMEILQERMESLREDWMLALQGF